MSAVSLVPRLRNCPNRDPSPILKLNRLSRQFTLLVSLALVTGCASRPVSQLPDIDDWEVRQQVLAAADDWEFSGRIAVSADEDGFNGKLRWTQDEDRFLATVSGPLGIGTVRIEGEGQRAVLTDKDGERTELRNVEADLLYRYGWTIPVKSLRYWALGIPDPAEDAQTELNDDNQMARLEQGGWTVGISSYRISSGQSMPNRLSAKNSSTRVRIVIDKWKFFD
ncbi:MAG: lipoprotein insertase outer membrane protein LolB [Woeseiaceae bacterium]